ncbi:MAG: hypothetical protein EOO38_30975, partial [Cytophagaceae bacterium]
MAASLKGKSPRLTRQQIAFALILFLSPYFFAFGTSNNYWWFGGLVGMFYLLAAIVLFGASSCFARPLATLMVIAFFSQLLTATQVQAGMEGPYYQPLPLSKSTTPATIGDKGHQLSLAPRYAAYIHEASMVLRSKDFLAGMPIIDLTGHSPGLLFALGATNTAQPWIIGNYNKQSKFGYAGSNAVAMAALKQTACDELAKAWIISEPEGPVRIDPTLLHGFGADLARDYDIVGTVTTPSVAGGFFPRQQQIFHKPRRAFSDAMRAWAYGRFAVAGERIRLLRWASSQY